jgi:2'-5' RNA ligase
LFIVFDTFIYQGSILMQDIKKIYTDMWLNAEQKIRDGQHEVDSFIGAAEDTRRGITALSYLKQGDNNVSSQIMTFIKELTALEPEQYYYPEDELHLTILSVISCAAGFMLKSVDVAEYRRVFIEATKTVGPLEIHYSGITASPGCVLIQGIPVNEQLQELRDNLRIAFRDSPLHSTIDSRYKITTAHSTIARFQAPLQDHHKLLALLSEYRTYDFGVCRINQLDLVFNNWYQHLSETKHLAKHIIR